MSNASFQLTAATVLSVAYAVFVGLMTDDFVLGDRTPWQMLLIVLTLLVACSLVLAALWARSLHTDGRRSLADEREEAIELAADRGAYRILDSSIFILLAVVLTDAQWHWLGSFALVRAEGVVFALVSVSALAAIARFGLGYLASRRQ